MSRATASFRTRRPRAVRRPASTRTLARRAVAVGLALAVALATLPAVLAALSPPAVAAATSAPSPALSTNLSFASRAGYATVYATEVVGAHPAAGPVPVRVTFSAPLGAAAYAAAASYFAHAGLSVSAGGPDRTGLDLTGSAGDVGVAFGTTLVAGTFQGSPAVYPSAPPSLPAALESEVAGVVGLSSGFTSFSFALAPSAVPGDAQTVTPGLAREFYNFSALYNLSGGPTFPTGTSIAVILWGDGYSPSDLSTFFSDYYPSSFPTPTVNAYPIDGAPAPSDGAPDSANAKAVEELTLDIEWAASMAPGATIDAIYAPNGPGPSYSPSSSDLTDALVEALNLNVSVISMSFGTAESSDSSLTSSWGTYLQDAANQGTTVLAATGDLGGDTSANPCSGTPAPSYPASSPMVVAVGGTDVTLQKEFGSVVGFSETAWNDSGGGFSGQFAAPSWQEVGTAAGPIKANGHRGMPDVSATAGDNFLFFNGSAAEAGGTSFATPLWAGLVADIDAKWGHRLGFFTPSLYHVGANEPSGLIGTGLVDIVGGANCVAQAVTGWDAATGWGTPRAAVLYDDLLGSFVNIQLNVSQTMVAPGGSISVTAHVTNRTSGAPIADVAVALSVSADTRLGPCTGTFGSASPTTNATGWVSGRFSVPVCYLGQHANVNASVTTTKLYGTTGVKVDVNLLGFDPALAFLTAAPWAYVTYVVIVGAAVVVGAWIGRSRAPPPPPGPPPGVQGTPAPSPPAGSPSPPTSPPTPPSGTAPPPGPGPAPSVPPSADTVAATWGAPPPAAPPSAPPTSPSPRTVHAQPAAPEPSASPATTTDPDADGSP